MESAMFKHYRWKTFVVAAALLGYAGIGVAEDYGDTVIRRHDYQKATGDRVSGIPGNQQLTKVDALGHRRIAFYTTDGTTLQVWLLTTDQGCERPNLVGSNVVSVGADGKTHSCSVERIEPVDQGALMTALWRDSSSSSDLISPDGFAGSDHGAYQIAASMNGHR
jgi:hypothetical protein